MTDEGPEPPETGVDADVDADADTGADATGSDTDEPATAAPDSPATEDTAAGTVVAVDDLGLDGFYDAVEAEGRPVVTATEVARRLGTAQASAAAALDDLVDNGTVDRVNVESDPVVYFPAEWRELAARERIVLFPDRREIIVDQPRQYTRAQLSQFAHLVDSTGDRERSVADGETTTRGYKYEIRPEDVWQAPFDDVGALLSLIRSVLPRRSADLEGWVQSQWQRANRFRLFTHDDGYVVLEAGSESLMGNVARQKLDEEQLVAPISETESWVREGSEAAVKRTLYEAGYPVVDDRELDTGDPVDVELTADLREYQQDWVDRFREQRSGVLVGPSGSGKTVTAIGILAAVGGESLILVPSRELAGQWRAELLEHTDLTEAQIGEYHGGEKEIRPITIATYRTAGMDRHRALFDSRGWGLVVYDECLSGDTVVETPSGRTTFAELDEEEGFDPGWNRGIDSPVRTFVPGEGYKWTDVTGVYKTRSTVRRIRTNVGHTLRATPSHTHVVFDPDTCTMSEQNGVSEGDYLVLPTPDPAESGLAETDEDHHNTAIAELTGWFIGDGHLNEYGDIKFSFARRAREQVRIISDLCDSLDAAFSVFENSRGDLTLRAPKLQEVLGWEGEGGAKTKSVRVPEEMYSWAPGRIGALLRGLFDAQGSVDEKGRIRINTVSQTLAADVSRLLFRLGILSRRITINRDDEAHSDVYRLTISPYYSSLFEKYVGFRLDHKAERMCGGTSPATGLPVGRYIERIKRDTGLTNEGISDLTTVSRQTIGDVIRGRYRLGQQHLHALADGLETASGKTFEDAAAARECLGISYSTLAAEVDLSTSAAYNRFRRGDRNIRDEVFEIVTERQSEMAKHAERLAALSGVHLIEVTDVEDVGTETVYDFETTTHTFLADGFLTHNCQHIPAEIYRRSADLQTTHRLGLSATPVREDDREAEIFTLIGPPIGTDWSRLFEAGYVQEPEVRIRYLPWGDDVAQNEWAHAEGRDRHRVAAENPEKIAETRRLLDAHPDASALVFVDWLDQGEALAAALDVPFVSGEMPHHRRDRVFESFREGDLDTVVVSRVGDEGIDLPNAEVAIVASGLGGSRRQGAQRAGRTMRPAGGSRVYVLATRGTSEEEFAQRQMRHLAEKGIRVIESNVDDGAGSGDDVE